MLPPTQLRWAWQHISCGMVAYGRGLTDIDGAANVLEPVAYRYAPQVLALAFIGTALLALLPLAGSAAHAVAGIFESKDKALTDRRISLALLIVMLSGGALGEVLTSAHVEPLRLMYWSAVLNGSTATPACSCWCC
jgi:hypothetical protein